VLTPALREKTVRSYARRILAAFAKENQGPYEPLSQQEQRVLRLLAAGRTNPEIARELVVSVNTVKDHLKHLYRKLGVNNRLQAVERARHWKLL